MSRCAFVKVKYSLEEPLYHSMCRAVTKIYGNIYASSIGEDGELKDGDDLHVGTIKLAQVFLDKKTREGIDSVYDSLDQEAELFAYVEMLDKIDFFQTFYMGNISRILIIKNIHIKSEFRGSNIGHSAIARSIEIFGGEDTLSVLIPCAVQFIEQNKDDYKGQFEGIGENEAKKKLQKYYSELGFKQLYANRFMIYYPDALSDEYLCDCLLDFDMEIRSDDSYQEENDFSKV